MIWIDFQSGAHGNYLEFVCNYFLANIPTKTSTPFNKLGSSHNKQYLQSPKFTCGHFSFDPALDPISGKIISVQIQEKDLLPLSMISFLRAGDQNYNNNQLEIDTYHKLNNINYRSTLENIMSSYNQVVESYQAVKDPSWPDIKSREDFNNLPETIKQECVQQHRLNLIELNEQNPDCPRYVLREFFKPGFQNPKISGFMQQQQFQQYQISDDVYVFPFGSFYQLDEFVKQIKQIAQWSGLKLEKPEELEQLHKEFLSRQPYKHSKQYCDQLISDIITGKNFDLPSLDLMCESYINAQLELHYNSEAPFFQPSWFKTAQEIRNYFTGMLQ